MKKNEHYVCPPDTLTLTLLITWTNQLGDKFPTMEFIKDATESCGWRRVTYDHGKPHSGLDTGILSDSKFSFFKKRNDLTLIKPLIRHGSRCRLMPAFCDIKHYDETLISSET
jgi:hypothetical protein